MYKKILHKVKVFLRYSKQIKGGGTYPIKVMSYFLLL